MYKYYVVLLCILVHSIACEGRKRKPEPPKEGTAIKVNFDNFKGGTVDIYGITGKNKHQVTSFEVDSLGKGKFERDKRLPGGLYYFVLPDKSFFQIFLDVNQHFQIKANQKDFVGSMEIKKSLENELFYEYLKMQVQYEKIKKKLKGTKKDDPAYTDIVQQRDELNDKIGERQEYYKAAYPKLLFSTFLKASENQPFEKPKKADGSLDKEKQIYLYWRKYWNNIDLEDDRLLRTPVFHEKLEKYIDKVTVQTADSLIKSADYVTRGTECNKEMFKYVANYLGMKYQKPKIMGGEAVYVYMVENFFTKKKAFWMDSVELYRLQQDAKSLSPSLVGKIGQNVVAQNPAGEKIALYDIKTPVVAFVLYSAGCPTCQKEIPEIKKVYDQWKDKGVEIFAMCQDVDQEKWKAFIKKNDLTWYNAIDPYYKSKYQEKYASDVLPEVYVMDSTHKIVAKDLKPNQLETIFKRVLDKKETDKTTTDTPKKEDAPADTTEKK